MSVRLSTQLTRAERDQVYQLHTAMTALLPQTSSGSLTVLQDWPPVRAQLEATLRMLGYGDDVLSLGEFAQIQVFSAWLAAQPRGDERVIIQQRQRPDTA